MPKTGPFGQCELGRCANAIEILQNSGFLAIEWLGHREVLCAMDSKPGDP